MFQSIINQDLLKSPELYLFIGFVTIFMVLINTRPEVILAMFRSIQFIKTKPKQIESMPDWSKAPKGAKWLAQDSDGLWRWHAIKPKNVEGYWASNEFASINLAGYTKVNGTDYLNSLSPKPKI